MKKMIYLPAVLLLACGGTEEKKGEDSSVTKEKEEETVIEEKEEKEISWKELKPAEFLGAKMGYITEDDDQNYFGELFWDVTSPFSEGIARVGKRDKDYNKSYGFINSKGEQIIDYIFSDAGDFNSGLAAVQYNKGGKYGYINASGELVLDTVYENKFDFSHGLALICNEKHKEQVHLVYGNPKYGFINPKGDTVIAMKYGYAHPFSEGVAAVLDGKLGQNKFGFIDTANNWVINAQYNMLYPYRDGIAPAYNSAGKLGFLKKDGSNLIPFQYDEFIYFYNNTISDYFNQRDIRYKTEHGDFMVIKNEKYGLINENNETVLDFDYDKMSVPNGDLIIVSKIKSKEGYKINYLNGVYDLKSAKEVVPVKYDYVYIPVPKYFEGWVNIENKSDPKSYTHDLKGIANVNTGAIIEPLYEDVGDFSEGLVAVKKDGKWGYVNEKNELVIDFKYDYHDEFEDGEAYVKLGEDYIYIDKNGKQIKKD